MEFKTREGQAQVVINEASMKSVIKLKNAIVRELTNSNLTLEDLEGFNAYAMQVLDSSEAVYRAVFECLERCTYNGIKINEDLFENVSYRPDYYEIIVNCLEVNLRPFFKSLNSMFTVLAERAKKKESQNQPSVTI